MPIPELKNEIVLTGWVATAAHEALKATYDYGIAAEKWANATALDAPNRDALGEAMDTAQRKSRQAVSRLGGEINRFAMNAAKEDIANTPALLGEEA